MIKVNNLEELRVEIDKIDIEIVKLIASRAKYIHQAASFKNTVEDVKAPARVEEVIQNVRSQALALGMSPNLVNDIYKLMIEDMVESEIAEFRNLGDF